MYLNLKAEYVRKGIEPYVGVMNTIKCSAKTAQNKLNGVTTFTVPEAFLIISNDFKGDGFTIDYLFANSDKTA